MGKPKDHLSGVSEEQTEQIIKLLVHAANTGVLNTDTIEEQLGNDNVHRALQPRLFYGLLKPAICAIATNPTDPPNGRNNDAVAEAQEIVDTLDWDTKEWLQITDNHGLLRTVTKTPAKNVTVVYKQMKVQEKESVVNVASSMKKTQSTMDLNGAASKTMIQTLKNRESAKPAPTGCTIKG